MNIEQLRNAYHAELCRTALSRRDDGVPNIADASMPASRMIAERLVEQVSPELTGQPPTPQRIGKALERATSEFLARAFDLLRHLRPGDWLFSVESNIRDFEQYEHLASLQEAITLHPELRSILGGDYVITPDIVVGRRPLSDQEINAKGQIVADESPHGSLTPFRAANRSEGKPLLHASISCKWTIRSDRAQNVRTEAMNLIRNRKGHSPHIMAITAEPLPSRIAALALGTGDLDCVYHVFLHELRHAVEDVGGDAQSEMLEAMIDGRRLRDCSDLPFDLAV